MRSQTLEPCGTPAPHRRYAAGDFPLIGPDKDVPAPPDVGTDQQVMAWIVDTCSQQVGYAVQGVVTGKPLSIGRQSRTRRSHRSWCSLRDSGSAQHLKLDVSEATVVIQGSATSAPHTARIMQQAGARVIAVSDVSGGLYATQGPRHSGPVASGTTRNMSRFASITLGRTDHQ